MMVTLSGPGGRDSLVLLGVHAAVNCMLDLVNEWSSQTLVRMSDEAPRVPSRPGHLGPPVRVFSVCSVEAR